MGYIKNMLMALLTALTVLSVTARDFEYAGLWYTVLDEESKTCKTKDYWDGSNCMVEDVENLIIPETVSDGSNSYTVVEIGKKSFVWSKMTSAHLPSSIKSISENGFSSCGDLRSIELPDNLTFLGNSAFRDCLGLESIKLPDSLTSIENMAFFSCTRLKSVELPKTLVSIGGGAFGACYQLSTIELPETIEFIGENAFHYTFLKTIQYNAKIPVIATDNVFSDSETYTEGRLLMPNTALADIQATTPWNLFKNVIAKDGSTGNTESPLPVGFDFEYGGIWYTVIDSEAYAVRTKDGYNDENPGNTYVGDLVIPDKVAYESNTIQYDSNEYTVVEIGHHGFSSLDGLTSVDIPNTVTTIRESAFRNCSNLQTLNLSNALSEVEGFVFNDCKSLTSVSLPESMTYVAERMFAGCENLTTVSLPSSIKRIDGWAFGGCAIEEIDFPESLESIGGEAFTGCGLKSVDFPNSLLEIWDRAFSGGQFTTLTLPESLQRIGDGAFYHCGKLESVALPASLTSIGGNAFGEADDALRTVTYNASVPLEADPGIFNQYTDFYKLATLNMPNATLASVQATEPWKYFGQINAMDGSNTRVLDNGEEFEHEGIRYVIVDSEARTCKTKEGSYGAGDVPGNEWSGELTLPSKVPNGNNEYTLVEVGQMGFWNCALTKVTLPNTVKKIGWSAFKNNGSLTELNLPESLEFIDGDAFQSIGISSLTLPESLTTLSGGTFIGCSNLESIYFPASLQELGGYAFENCDNIREITYTAENPIEADYRVFGEQGNSTYANAVLNTPNATLASVQAIDPWRNFGKIVAKDGSFGFGLATGDDFEYEGLWYTVLDADAKTCKTKEGSWEYDHENDRAIWTPGNTWDGELTVPQTVNDGNSDYNVVEIGAIGFCLNNGLSKVFLPEGLTKIGSSAFISCDNLTDIYFPESLTAIGNNAFNCCGRLSSPALPKSLSEIGQEAFRDCDAIESVVLPDGLTELAKGVFYACGNLKSVTFSPNITAIRHEAFTYSGSLRSVTLPESLIEIEGDVFYGGGLESIELPGSCSVIGGHAFMGCPLSKVVLPGSLTSIGAEAFRDCNGIIDVSYEANVPITAEESIFMPEVYANATLSMPNAALMDVQATEPWRLFGHINAADGSVAPALSAGEDFEYEGLLYTVIDTEAMTCETKAGHREDLPNYASSDRKKTGHFGVTGVTFPGNRCEGDIVIPAKVSDGSNEYTVVRIGTDGFHDCENLRSVTFPNTLEVIGEAAFEDAGLVRLDLPESLREIIHSAFISCDSLESVKFNDGLQAIGSVAFYGCGKLRTVEFPASMERIENAFDSCVNISRVIYNAEIPIQTSDWLFEWNVYDNAVLDMPNASLADIRSTACWNQFKHINAKDGNLTFTATFTIDGETIETRQFEYGEKVIVPDAPEREGHTFAGWQDVPETMPAHDITIIGSYTVNRYTLTYMLDGEVYAEYDVEYGAAITPEADPTKVGHTFGGWQGLPETMPAHDVTVTGSFSVNTYTAEFVIDGETIETRAFEYGAEVTTPDAPEREGHTFGGWQDVPETMPAHDITITGSYTEIPESERAEIRYNGRYVTIECADPDARILWHHEDANTADFTEYSGPFDAMGLHTVTAVTEKEGFRQSEPTMYAIMSYADETHAETREAGHLADAFGWMAANELEAIEEYDVLGYLDADDYAAIRTMKALTALDLSGVLSTDMPDHALAGMNIVTLRLPSGAESYGNGIVDGDDALCAMFANSAAPLTAGTFGTFRNPNLLLYLTDAAAYAGGVDWLTNVITLEKGWEADAIRLTDGQPFHCPEAFNAGEVAFEKSFSRPTVIGGMQGWETLSLPFAVDEIRHKDFVLQPFGAYEATDSTRPFWLHEAGGNGWTKAQAVEAYRPYLISMPNCELYDESFNIEGAVTFIGGGQTIAATPDPEAEAWKSGHWLWANFSRIPKEDGLLVTNSLETDGPAGSMFVAGEHDVEPFECYVTTVTGRRMIPIFDSSEVEMLTGNILRIWSEEGDILIESPIDTDASVHDLAGQLVRTATVATGMTTRIAGLTPGVYFVNGTKVLVK